MTPELLGLTGIRIRIRQGDAALDGVRLVFDLPEPAQALGGFFRSEKKGAAAAPPAEEWEPILRNGIVAEGDPGFTVWANALPAGRNELDLGRGAYVVLGFTGKDAQPEPRVVFFGSSVRPERDCSSSRRPLPRASETS